MAKDNERRYMKHTPIILLVALLLVACGNKSKQGLPPSDVEEGWGEKYQEDMVDTVKTVKIEAPSEEHQARSRVSTSNTSSYTSDDDDYDNMRGWDPASEDDMDDNGMSRYMENTDDEGWD